MGQVSVRWCWFIDEVNKVKDLDDSAPTPMSAVTCEDTLLMRISIDALESGAARFTGVRDFARKYLNITSHRVIYRMLNMLCKYGLVRFSRGSTCKLSDYDCAVSRTGCRITAIKPTSMGLILASTTSLAFYAYLDMYAMYVRGEFNNRKDLAVQDLIKHSMLNVLNVESFNATANSMAEEEASALAQHMYVAAVEAYEGLGKGIDKLITIADALSLNTPEETYAFRSVVFSGHARRFLGFLLTRLTDRALRHGLDVGDVRALTEDLLNDRVENINDNGRHWGLIEALAKIEAQEPAITPRPTR